MSTVILEGIRFRPSRLNDVIDHYRNGLRAHVLEKSRSLIEYYASQIPDGHPDTLKEESRLLNGLHTFMKECANEAKRTDQDRNYPLRIECEMMFWYHRGWVYAAPKWEWMSFSSGVTRPDFVEDYAYWNNVDPDYTVTTAEWKRRKKNWGHAWVDERTLRIKIIDVQTIRGQIGFRLYLEDELGIGV